MFNRKQRQIDFLHKEVARLNMQIIDSIIPALEKSTVAVGDSTMAVVDALKKAIEESSEERY